jgi:hypothetical protein
MGTYVADALAPNLLTGATLGSAATSDGTVWEALWPGKIRFELTTGTVSGTNPTLDIQLKGCEDSAFSGTVVSYGSFAQRDTTDNVTAWLDLDIQSKYLKAVVITGGTNPVFTGSTLYPRAEQYHKVPRVDTA